MLNKISSIPSVISNKRANFLEALVDFYDRHAAFLSPQEKNIFTREKAIEYFENIFSPIFQPRLVETRAGTISSEMYNRSLLEAKFDMSSLYSEIDNLLILQDLYNDNLDKHIEDNLDKRLKLLQQRVDELSILMASKTGLDNFFLYRMNNAFLQPYDNGIYFFVKNPRLFLPESNRLGIDDDAFQGKLPKTQAKIVQFLEATILNSQSTASDYDIDLETPINNILRSNKEYWIKNIALDAPRNEGTRLELHLDLGGLVEINSLNIKPLAEFPFKVVGISYIDSANVTLPLSAVSNLLGSTLDRPIDIYFPRVQARAFVLAFEQHSYSHIQLSPESNQVDNLVDESMNTQELIDTIASQSIAVDDDLTIYNYTIGFDNISAGLTEYEDYGLVVTKDSKLSQPGVLSLTYEGKQDPFVQGDIQMYVRLHSQSYEQFLPILRTTDTGDITEAVTPVDKVIVPRFLAHNTANVGADVIVYRDGISLVRGVDWAFVDRVTPAIIDDPNIQPGQSNTRIELFHSDATIAISKYAVQYRPRHLQSNVFKPVQLDNNVLIDRNNLLHINNLEEVNINLYVYMFKSHLDEFTPVLNNVSLGFATTDGAKLSDK